MRRLLDKSLLLLSVLATTAVVGLLVLCWQYGIWSWHDWQIYQAMSNECHPVWRDLHAGRIKAGDDVEGLIWRTHPNRIREFEDVKILTYGGGFTGVTIASKGGHVMNAQAWSCTWEWRFFDQWSPEEKQAFNNRFDADHAAKAQARWIDEVVVEAALRGLLACP